MSNRLRVCFLLAAACLLPLLAIAQSSIGEPLGGGAGNNTIASLNRYQLQQMHWLVSGKVTTLRGDTVARAKVVVAPTGAQGEPRSLLTDLQGQFRTDYWLSAERVKDFAIELNVTKKGYLRAHAFIDFGSSGKTWVIPVTLRDLTEDPKLLAQADLISALAPRLATLKPADGLSTASEKDYGRGVTEFLQERRPDRALVFLTKVTSHDASCMPCRTQLALAELDSGDWEGAYYNLVEVFNKIQADSGLGCPEPFVVLGVMESWRHRPETAAGYFAKALKFAPQDPLALQELGRTQLLMQNWPAADEDLRQAIAAGAKPETRLLRAEALLGEGKFHEAAAEMVQYLKGRDVKTMPLEVRKLWAEIENHKKIEAAYAKARNDALTFDYLHHPPSDLKGLDPSADQTPLASILSSVGTTVEAFFANFPNTSSVEQVHSERLHGKQKVSSSLDQKFRYLCFTPARAFGPGFEEYRSDLAGSQAGLLGLADGFMLTSGFASTSLVFHPAYQSQAEFRYLGRQRVGGRDADVVAFAQQPAKAKVNGSFNYGLINTTTFSQGLAWIDSENYQIIRLRTDLLRPLMEVKLEKITTDILYGETHFKDVAIGFWVPTEVTVDVDWNGRHLRNEHRYSEFKVFNVEATEKQGTPKELGQAQAQPAVEH